MIYYFSGTGNSRWVAEQLAGLSGDQAVDLAPLVPDKSCTLSLSVGRGERIGLVFPIYAWGAPKIVDEFLAAVTVEPVAYAFAVCTCGDDAGRAMEKLKKRFPWNAAWSISMPNNYIPMYDVDAPELTVSKIAAAQVRISAIARDINAQKSVMDIRRGAFAGVKTSIINPLFKTFAASTRPFTVDPACTGCGLCQANCPRGAIRLSAGKPIWVKKHCLQCMACIQRCPVTAIQYGEATRTRGRYCFPNK